MILTLLFTVTLEAVCWKYTLQLWKTKRTLYVQGVFLNFFNHCVLGPLVIAPVVRWYVPRVYECDFSNLNFSWTSYDVSYCDPDSEILVGDQGGRTG